jgi:hypothetical protein
MGSDVFFVLFRAQQDEVMVRCEPSSWRLHCLDGVAVARGNLSVFTAKRVDTDGELRRDWAC